VSTFAWTLLAFGMAGLSRLGAQAASHAGPASPAPAIAVALGSERSVPVAARALARGVALSPADYRIATVLVRPALRSAAAADSGWVTRRAVAEGEALIEPAVGPPALVTAGQAVSFVAETGPVRLSVRGTAASTGALGDRVWVRMDSGRRLRGVVAAPGTVRADTTSIP
jgi:flagella basal body P-ring formation protein FlgA